MAQDDKPEAGALGRGSHSHRSYPAGTSPRHTHRTPRLVIGEAQPKDLMHQGSVSEPFYARSFAYGSG